MLADAEGHLGHTTTTLGIHGFMPRNNPILGTFSHAPSASIGRSRFFKEDVTSKADHDLMKTWRHNPYTGQFHVAPNVYSKLHGLHRFARLRKSMSTSLADRLGSSAQTESASTTTASTSSSTASPGSTISNKHKRFNQHDSENNQTEGENDDDRHDDHNDDDDGHPAGGPRGHLRRQTSVSEPDLEGVAAVAAHEPSYQKDFRDFLRHFHLEAPGYQSDGTVSVPDYNDWDGHMSDTDLSYHTLLPAELTTVEDFGIAPRNPVMYDDDEDENFNAAAAAAATGEDAAGDDDESVRVGDADDAADADDEDEDDDTEFSGREVSSFGLGSASNSLSHASNLNLASGNHLLASKSTPPPLQQDPPSPFLPALSFSAVPSNMLLEELSLPGSAASIPRDALEVEANEANIENRRSLLTSSASVMHLSAPRPIPLRRRCRSSETAQTLIGSPSPTFSTLNTAPYSGSRGSSHHRDASFGSSNGARARASTSVVSASTATSATNSQGSSDEDLLAEETQATNPWIINRTQEIKAKYKLCMDETLGKGAYSVCKVCENRVSHRQFAVKIVRKRLLVSASEKQMVKREVELHQVLRHRNIVRLYEIFEDPARLFLILEKVDGGTLDQLLLRNGGKLPESVCCNLAGQLLDAVQYLHNYGVLQGDLKPANLLLSKQPGAHSDDPHFANYTVKVCDFGLSRKVPDVKYYKVTGDVHKVPYTDIVGTMGYVAPEILRHEAYTVAVDVWAVGIILYEMLSGIRPFVPYKDCLTQDLTFPAPVFGHISTEAMSLVVALLQRTVAERPTAAEALRHLWFRSRSRDALLFQSASAASLLSSTSSISTAASS